MPLYSYSSSHRAPTYGKIMIIQNTNAKTEELAGIDGDGSDIEGWQKDYVTKVKKEDC